MRLDLELFGRRLYVELGHPAEDEPDSAGYLAQSADLSLAQGAEEVWILPDDEESRFGFGRR